MSLWTRRRSCALVSAATFAVIAAACGRTGPPTRLRTVSTSSADPIVFNDNGACSWFEDERAVIDPATGTHPTNSTADDLRPIVTYTKRPVRPPSSDQSGPPA